MSEHLKFKPPPICAKYIQSTAPVTTIMGPLGSAKTSSSCMKIMYHTMRSIPSIKDGKRKSKYIIIRNTSDQLNDTVLQTWLTWFPDGTAGVWKQYTRTYYISFGDVYAEVLFRALDRPDDVRKLLSLDTSAIFFNELREIDYNIFTAARSRCGRYPQPDIYTPEYHRDIHGIQEDDPRVQEGEDGEKKVFLYDWKGVMADSNPPPEKSWFYYMREDPIKLFKKEEFVPTDWEHFTQPGGRTQKPENVENLPPGYYEDLVRGAAPSWVTVHVDNEYGPLKAGLPVYQDTFDFNTHVTMEPIKHNPALPIAIGLDFGRTPAAILKQREPTGRIITLREVIGTNIGLERFLDEQLLSVLQEFYPNMPCYVCPDPAGFAKAQANEDSLVDIVERRISEIVHPGTNDPKKRVSAVEVLLGKSLAGKTQYLIDGINCPILVTGFRSGYVYREKRDGTTEPFPYKNDYSHPHDANQYVDMVLSHHDAEGVNLYAPQHVEIEQVSMAGWM